MRWQSVQLQTTIHGSHVIEVQSGGMMVLAWALFPVHFIVNLS